jgi:serine/threonine protein kinase
MEWIPGSNLLSSIKEENIGQFDAIRITRGILHGLSHLHSKRILHRDLKPANILLDGITPKITDFGSAAVLPEGATSVPASRHSALYVPPEGWGDHPFYSMASDIYQVGMVLYELVNGPLEYGMRHYLTPKVLRELRASGRNYDLLDGCDQSQQVDRGIAELASRGRLLVHGRPPRICFSDKLRRMLGVATRTEPNERFPSADAFIARLNQVDVPNWRQPSDSNFLAENWRGWDWRISVSAGGTVLQKARPSTDRFRKVSNREFSTPAEAFAYVEQL